MQCQTTENDKYVIFNYVEKVWYYGNLSRDAWLDRGIRNLPMATDSNHCYITMKWVLMMMDLL